MARSKKPKKPKKDKVCACGEPLWHSTHYNDGTAIRPGIDFPN